MSKKEFSSGDATVAAFGQEIEFKKISYSKKQEMNTNHTGNNKATSWSTGKEECECKLEVFMSQKRLWEQMQKKATGKANLIGLQVPLAITYLNEDLGECTDIVNVVLKNQGREVAGGADGLAFEFDTLCLDVQFDV